jgi:hypothetical protein
MSNITKSARGESCTVFAPGVTQHDPDTVVFAHLNSAGMGIKDSDLFGCYACYLCHTWLDFGYVRDNITKAHRNAIHYEAIIRTQRKLLEKGLIKI